MRRFITSRLPRHMPLLCGFCQAPLACQEPDCWHCGAFWFMVIREDV